MDKEISIHALREEGDQERLLHSTRKYISIHALREEGDFAEWKRMGYSVKFLSTPSARRATLFAPLGFVLRAISIHALREEGDLLYLHRIEVPSTISIHALREEGDLLRPDLPPPVRPISIHALREEGDQEVDAVAALLADFYPRPPRGGRQQKQRQKLYFQTNYTTFCTNLEEP